MPLTRDAQSQLEKIDDVLENIKLIELIGVDGLDIYFEPNAYPNMAAELALAIKPVLIKHRNKIKMSSDIH